MKSGQGLLTLKQVNEGRDLKENSKKKREVQKVRKTKQRTKKKKKKFN